MSQVSNAETEAESDGGDESEDNGPDLSDDSEDEDEQVCKVHLKYQYIVSLIIA